jgi:hypothetical protein
MTQVSEAVPSAAHNLPSIWGSFWEVDKTQWQWQAPTPRPATQDKSAVALPAWLLEWDTTPKEKTAESADAEVTPERPLEDTSTAEQDLGLFRNIREFRESLKVASSRSTVERVLSNFCGQFQKSLCLGVVSQNVLDYALQIIPRDIRAANTAGDVSSILLLEFYTAVWEGVASCKVLGPADIHANIMSRLLSGVVSLPLTDATRALAQKILRRATTSQLRPMKKSLSILVQKWMESWLEFQKPGEYLEEFQAAEILVTEALENVTKARRAVMAMEEGPNNEEALSMAQEAIAGANAAVMVAIDATTKVEDIWWPIQASVKGLARTLQTLPVATLRVSLPVWSKQLAKAYAGKGTSPSPPTLAFPWLTAVARMPNVDFGQLVQIWRQVDPANRLPLEDFSQVIFEHWTSHGKVTKALAVQNALRDFTIERPLHNGSERFARLLLALDKHRQMSWSRALDVFDLLRKLGRKREILNILYWMKKLGMKVPSTLLGAAMEKMGFEPAMMRRALVILDMPNTMKLDSLRTNLVSNFVISLIDAPGVPPGDIWKLLGIPIYEGNNSTKSSKFQREQASPLPPEMIALLHKMATAFARSEARPPRVAFRNIIQCVYHLQLHNAPISPELTRAVNHVCTTRSILGGLYVPQERLRYALYHIAQVEGEGVARKVDHAVFNWRQNLRKQRARDGGMK